MPTISVSEKSLKIFNEVRAVIGGQRKKAINQPEMFNEILEEFRKNKGV
jgi:hypothetical protein